MNDRFNKVLFIFLFIIGFLIFFKDCRGRTEVIEIEKTDTLTVTDTIFKTDTFLIEKPIPVKEEIIKIDTFYDIHNVPVYLATETKEYNDTLCNQNDSIILKNYISGVNASLDSMKVDWRKQEITNTITVTKFVKDKKKLCYGPSITTGYDLVNKQWGIMAGVSLIYRF